MNHKTKFPCKHGKQLKKLMNAARHADDNIYKIQFGRDCEGSIHITDAWGYDGDNRRRKAVKNEPMDLVDCQTVCSNMHTEEVMNFINEHCAEPQYCECSRQICDDVYERHGHGRLSEIGNKFMEILFKNAQLN